MMNRTRIAKLLLAISTLTGLMLMAHRLNGQSVSLAPAPAPDRSVQERGFHNLAHKAYGVPVLNPAILEKIWTVWEPAWKDRVNPNDRAQIRSLIFERYGVSEPPYENGGAPMQFVPTEKGWVPTCMQCHGGRLPGSGKSMIGLPNTEIDLATLAEDLARSFGMKGD